MAPHLPRGFSASSSASSSSSSNEELVDSILSQAMDQVALEQIAALNTAHLDDDCVLPGHLESRFRKLKSFPGAAPATRARSVRDAGKDHAAAAEEEEPGDRPPPREMEVASAPEQEDDQTGNERLPNTEPRSVAPPLDAGRQASADKIVPTAPPDSRSSKHGSLPTSPPTSSPSASLRSRGLSHSPRRHLQSRSPSPPRGCCFGLSPVSKQKISSRRPGSRGAGGGTRPAAPRDLNSGARGGGGEWGLLDDDDALLAELELGTLSIKEQGKRMKRALREQEKAAREAEKIVEWVRQASARIEYSAAAAAGMDELFSDEEKENRR